MALFYCVGFPDLANKWARHGHVSGHKIYTDIRDAEKANEGLITCVHEFYVPDRFFDKTIAALKDMEKN